MTAKAKKLSAYLFLLVLPLGVGTVGLASRANQPRKLKSADASRETDAAYRDGLYLGRLDGQEGRKVRPSVARWNANQDRASFLFGYQEGYREGQSARIGEHRH